MSPKVYPMGRLTYESMWGRMDYIPKHLLIYLTQPDSPGPRENPGCVRSVDVRCLDDLGSFSGTQAIKIAEAVKDVSDVEVIICVCEAGMSRSAAVAASLIRAGVADGDLTEYFGTTRQRKYGPNQHIYDLMKEALGIPPPLFVDDTLN